MRLSEPRIAALSDDEMTPAQRDLVKPVGAPDTLNIFRTLVAIPEALSAFKVWGGYVVSRHNGLSLRDAEILILRTAVLCRSGYEWTQHAPVAARAGLTADEIAALRTGADAGWTDREAALIRAAEELHAGQHIGDATWTALKAHLSDKQCMDLVFLVGQYTQVAMMANSFGIQVEAGKTVDPAMTFPDDAG